MTGPRKMPTIEEYNEYVEKRKRYNREYTKKHLDYFRAYKSRSVELNYGQAHNLVNNAIKRGEIVRLPCEICGKEPAEAHHCDYNKPLDVMWLCREHHTEWHINNTPIFKKTQKNS